MKTAFLAAVAFSVAAGAAQAEPTIQSCDRRVTFEAPPERAISNDVNLTEMMLVLDLADRMVGYTGISGWNKLDEEMTAGVEALPEPEALISFSKTMFFNDESRLEDFVDQAIFERTKEILLQYSVVGEVVSLMKPWSAFLTMNYPAESGLPLDLVLLAKAKEAGAMTHGLETMQEQADIFDSLLLDEQARLLIDTVCHYDVVEEDFIAMKSFYLEQDLGGLYNYVNRYSSMQEPLYQDLMYRLIDKRNEKMVERMMPLLKKGDAFIAIGAMHLPGEKGVLALLKKQGFNFSAIY